MKILWLLRHSAHPRQVAYKKMIEPMKVYANVVLGREDW